MSKNQIALRELREVHTCRPDIPDDLFICFASFEERCLGVVRRFRNYTSKHSYIFHILDEASEDRERHCNELKGHLSEISSLKIIDTQHKDPIIGMLAIAKEIKKACPEPERSAITLDITTFPKKQLLLMLRLLDQMGLFDSVRILYTEPERYAIHLDQPLSFGLKEVAVVPTFTGRYDPQKELTLIIFLGYEGDRALALWENIEPHRTIVVIPKPAYHREWEGKTEEMNPALLAAIESDSVLYADSRNPHSTAQLLDKVIRPDDETRQSNWYIAPLGTKLQAVGVYYFISKHPEVASVVYASPLQHNEPYLSTGVGKTWGVPPREG